MFGLLQVFHQSDLTLKDIKVVETCEFESLKSIASSKRQMQFLQILSNSQQFIEWLQNETKGNCMRIAKLCIPKHRQFGEFVCIILYQMFAKCSLVR